MEDPIQMPEFKLNLAKEGARLAMSFTIGGKPYSVQQALGQNLSSVENSRLWCAQNDVVLGKGYIDGNAVDEETLEDLVTTVRFPFSRYLLSGREIADITTSYVYDRLKA